MSSEEIIEIISNNIVKVCDKPAEAGSYWDIRVKGDGEAGIRLKLAKLGLTGEAEFSKGEWEGVRSTVENSKSYRDCVTKLSPIFIEKFIPLIKDEEVPNPTSKILGGIKWQEFGLGVNITLEKCSKQSSTVTCFLTANSQDSDITFYIYGTSAIYDQNGSKYASNYASLANFKWALKSTHSYLGGELVRGVDTPLSIRFTDVEENVESISKVSITSRVRGDGVNDEHIFEFRNVKIALN